MSGPIETKVSAATIASAVSGLIVWALQGYVFRGEVPFPVSSAVQVIVPAVCAFGAGWFARHTPRPDLAGGSPVIAIDDPEVTGLEASTGRHVDDGEPTDIPASWFRAPNATRGPQDRP